MTNTNPPRARSRRDSSDASLLPRGGYLGALPDGPLIGRTEELVRLIKALDATHQGQGQLLMLLGEPGVGKTRLAQEVSVRASERGFFVLVGRCYEERASLPLYPFAEALSAALQRAPHQFGQQGAGRWPELAALLTRTPTRSTAVARLGSSVEAQLHLFSAIAAFIRELSVEKPIALLLDDVHWADSASIGLLIHLARDLAADRVLLLATYRDAEVGRRHPLASAVRDLTRERLLNKLAMRGLVLESTAALIGARLGFESIPDEFVRLVHARTEGNPFFVEEVVSALVDRQPVSDAASLWDGLIEKAGVLLPDSVRVAIDQRVQLLEPRARELLRIASVLGQEFELALLLAVTTELEDAVLADLDSAIDARLIQERQLGRGERYGFIHALVHQALYADRPAQRRRLHQRAGEALERLQGSRAAVAAELARHFLAAGVEEPAMLYSIAAGDHAAGLYAHAEAARHYQQALELLLERNEQMQAAEVRCKLASELADLNRHAEALAAYEAALATFEREHDTLGQARAHRGMGRVYQDRYDLAAELPHLEAALRLSPDDVSHERASLLLDSVRARWFAADVSAAAPLALRALELAQELGDVALQARALTELAGVQLFASPYLAEAQLRQAEPLARRAEDWRTLTRIHLMSGHCWQVAGEWEHCRSQRELGIAAAERAGETERIMFGCWVLALTCLQLGAWGDGRAAARRAAALDPHWNLRSQPGPAYLAWLEGRPSEAEEALQTYTAASRERNDFQGLLTGLFVLAEFALQRDRVDDALIAAKEGLAILERSRFWPMVGMVAGPLAEALAVAGIEDAESSIADLERLAVEHEQHVSDAQFLRARAILQRRQGNVAAAIATLQASATLARGQKAVIQLGRTLAVLSEIAESVGDHDVADEADAERTHIVRCIGQEVLNLVWSRATTPADMRPRYPDGLTYREIEVLRLISTGRSNIEIAEQLVLSVRTVERHISNLYGKIGARNRADATGYTLRHGLA